MRGARQLVDDALVLGVPHAQLHALHQGRVPLFGGGRGVLVVAVALGDRGLDDVRRHTRADGPAKAAAVTTLSKVSAKSFGRKLPCSSLTMLEGKFIMDRCSCLRCYAYWRPLCDIRL